MRKTLLVVLVAIACLTGCGSQSWTEYRSKAGGFSVETPGTMKESTENVATPVAGNLSFHMAEYENRSTGYFAAYADFPDWLVKQDHKKLLEGARDGALKNVDGKLDKEAWITLEGNQGLEMTFTSKSKQMKAKARIYLVKNRLFQTIAAQTEDGFDEKEIDRFLNSFKLRPKL